MVGNGAREHCLVWKLSQSPKVSRLFAAPGNAGTARIAVNLAIKVNDFPSLLRKVQEEQIELIVVGPEVPLAEGIVDFFQSRGIPIFGPDKAAAQLEASKAFSKALFQKYHIPCAESRTFENLADAHEYIREKGAPLVVKADGLAAGKGVIMAETVEEALSAAGSILEAKTFGAAGEKVLVEEKLSGQEMSYFAISDGQNVLPLVPACDYKRAEDGDLGLNTGGMGSYSPPYFFTPELEQKILSTIIYPTVEAMRLEGRPFRGVLFAGLMVKDGIPKTLEFNVRLGDPECQVILPRLESDLLEIILAALKGDLKSQRARWSTRACVGVVVASGGYPGEYKTGFPIGGLDRLDPEVLAFHAGTKPGQAPGEAVTSGGRVLTLAALGENVSDARRKIYTNIDKIKFDGSRYRRDIARL